jgi:hypothetical protein
VFCPLLSSSKHSGIPEDSQPSTFPSVGLHPHTWPKWGCDTICVLQWFFDFCDKFDAFMAHNMLALMLDPRFKTLKCVTNLIGRDKTHVIMDEYDSKILIPMLVVVFKCLNPSLVKTPPPQTHVEDESLFGVPASNEVNESLLKFELFLF